MVRRPNGEPKVGLDSRNSHESGACLDRYLHPIQELWDLGPRTSRSPSGQVGQRAGRSAGGSQGRPRHCKMARMTGGSVIRAMSLRFSFPQYGHRRAERSKTRFNNSAQVYRLRLSSGVSSAGSGLHLPLRL